MELRSTHILGRAPPPPPANGGRSIRRRGPPGAEPDRISALPDEMLLLVLARLGCVRTAVQTSLLSRRWRGLWTGLTDLAFRRLAPATIEAALASFARSSVVSLCDIPLPSRDHAAAQGNSLLRSVVRLSPDKLVFTVPEPELEQLEPRWNNGPIIELPCLPSTAYIELDTKYLRVKPPLAAAGEFTALERLSSSGRIVGLGNLLSRCPRLRVLRVGAANWDEGWEELEGIHCLMPPPVGELTALESLSLAGRIEGLDSFLYQCRRLRVLSVTYMDSRKLTLPSDGEFPILEKLCLAGNIADLGTTLNRCPCLRTLSVTFRGVALNSIEAALTTLEEVVPLGLALCLLGINYIRRDPGKQNIDAARFTSLLLTAARLSPQEFAFRHIFNKHYSAHLPSFPRTTSIAMHLDKSIRFRRIPEAAADFSALEKLSLAGGCRPVNLATMVSRCKRLRELTTAVTTGKLKIHSASLQRLYATTDYYSDVHSIDIVAPLLKQFQLVVWHGGDTTVSISAPMVEHVCWERNHIRAVSASMPGFWRLRCLRLEVAQDTCSLGVLCLHISATKHLGELVITKELEALLITDFSVLELHLEDMSDHLFGAVVLRLFGIHRIRATTKRLKLVTPPSTNTQAVRTCPVTCPCDENKHHANQNPSSTCLEEVEMENFNGGNQDHDFLTRILGCSPMLKKVSLNLASSGTCTKEVEDIFLAYPSVSCYVYHSSGKLARCISEYQVN